MGKNYPLFINPQTTTITVLSRTVNILLTIGTRPKLFLSIPAAIGTETLRCNIISTSTSTFLLKNRSTGFF